jgi:uncharacterized protein YkwD
VIPAASALAFAALAALPTPSPVPTLTPDSGSLALRAVNAARANSGTAPLSANATLDRVAQASAERVAADAAGKDIGKRVTAAGYAHRRVAEIVLIGDGDLPARLARLHDSDPETFADVVAPDYQDLGFGRAEGKSGTVRTLVFGLSLSGEFTGHAAALGDLRAVRAQMFARVNGARATKGLPPLLENPLLDAAAQNHAEDMIRRSYYAHDSPDGATVMERVRRVGYPAAAVGENIGEGQATVAEVFDGWMKSPKHRDHILSLTLREIGMGVAFGKNGRGYEIVWVQDFATPR